MVFSVFYFYRGDRIQVHQSGNDAFFGVAFHLYPIIFDAYQFALELTASDGVAYQYRFVDKFRDHCRIHDFDRPPFFDYSAQEIRRFAMMRCQHENDDENHYV